MLITFQKNKINMEDDFVYSDLVQDYIPSYYSKFLTELMEPLKRYSPTVGKHIATDREGQLVDACARYANERLRALGYDVAGHAWTRMHNMQKIYSGYDAIRDKRPQKYSRKDLNRFNKMAAEDFKNYYDNLQDLRDNDVVSMYYNDSRALEEAYNNGIYGNTNTHTGNIVMIDGVPYVDHNIHGEAYVEPLSKLLGGKGKWGVTEIWRPQERDPKIVIKPYQWNESY